MLGYRSCFSIAVDRNPNLSSTNAIARLLSDIFQWLKEKKRVREIDFLGDGEKIRTRTGATVAYLRGKTQSGVEYARVIYRDPPQKGYWETSILIALERKRGRPKATVLVEVDAEPDKARQDRPVWTDAPIPVRQWLETYECYEHDLQLAASPILISDEESLEQLIRSIEDPRRSAAIIVCAEDGTVDVQVWIDTMSTLTAKTVGQASTFVLEQSIAKSFNQHASTGLQLHPYCPRIFKANANLSDQKGGLQHRAISLSKLLNVRTDVLVRMFGRICRDEFRSRPLEKSVRRLQAFSTQELALTRETTHHNPHPAEPAPNKETALPVNTFELSDAGDKNPQQETLFAVVDHTATAPRLDNELEDARARIAYLEAERLKEAERREIVEGQLKSLRLELEKAIDKKEMELEESNTQLDDLKLLQLELQDELDKSRADLRRTNYQLQAARKTLRENLLSDGSTYEVVNEYKRPEINAWEELQYLAADAYTNLRFECDWERALELSSKSGGDIWLETTLDILKTLDNYVKFRTGTEGAEFSGGLREFLKGEETHSLVHFSPERFRQTESEYVKNNKRMLAERRFRVSQDVDPSGLRTMFTHIEVQTNGTTSPRIYIEDRVNDLGCIVVGYIGKHLPNKKTN